eukprot:COSAG04_NODE_171_length_21611_cov_4.302808_6_plen_245_part_00
MINSSLNKPHPWPQRVCRHVVGGGHPAAPAGVRGGEDWSGKDPLRHRESFPQCFTPCLRPPISPGLLSFGRLALAAFSQLGLRFTLSLAACVGTPVSLNRRGSRTLSVKLWGRTCFRQRVSEIYRQCFTPCLRPSYQEVEVNRRTRRCTSQRCRGRASTAQICRTRRSSSFCAATRSGSSPAAASPSTAHSSKERRRPLFWPPFSTVTEPPRSFGATLWIPRAKTERKAKKWRKNEQNGRETAI